MLYFDSIISLIPESIKGVNLGLHHDFPSWCGEHIIFFISVLLISPHFLPHFSLPAVLSAPSVPHML